MMIVAIILSTLSLILVIYQIHVIERILNEVLSLYALMQENHLHHAYDRCNDYLLTLETCSLLTLVDSTKPESRQSSTL